jgi:hypothetical protein
MFTTDTPWAYTEAIKPTQFMFIRFSLLLVKHKVHPKISLVQLRLKSIRHFC